MAFNPMKLMKLKDRYHLFVEDHPKVMPFARLMNQKAVMEGTVVEIRVKTPDGAEHTCNFKMTPTDVETIRMFV